MGLVIMTENSYKSQSNYQLTVFNCESAANCKTEQLDLRFRRIKVFSQVCFKSLPLTHTVSRYKFVMYFCGCNHLLAIATTVQEVNAVGCSNRPMQP